MNNKILKTVYSDLKNMNITSDDKLCVGLSGGADSVFLLHTVFDFIKNQKEKPTIEAVYYNHGDNIISKNTHLDISLCQKTCDALNIKLKIINITLEKTIVGYEAEARKLRLENYQSLVNHDIYTKVLLGHHKDDHVETIFYQILRGMGTGASGIKSQEKHFLRPLLKINKKDIVDYLNDNNISFITDETNENNQFTRNFLRNKLFPTMQEHWTDYKERLIFVGKKIEEQSYLLECLAKQDVKINNNQVELLTTDPKRIKNAFKFYLKQKNISSKDSVLDEIVKIVFMQKNNVSVTFENFSILKQKNNSQKIIFEVSHNTNFNSTSKNCNIKTI